MPCQMNRSKSLSIRCAPLKTLDALLAFEPNAELRLCVGKTIVLRAPKSTPLRLLVCHDFEGGYTQDWSSQGIFDGSALLADFPLKPEVIIRNMYTFTHWDRTDVFVFFAHSLVAIPPVVWINAAHKNGVPILGTFMSEWKSAEIQRFLDGPNGENTDSTEPSLVYADQLVEIAKFYRFDGWFINVESSLESAKYVHKMLAVMKHMRTRLAAEIPGSQLIWYDSVNVNTGGLSYENELNDQNRAFFDISDSIFTNYLWNLKKPSPIRSALEAG
eukprot:434255_1